MRKPLAKFKTEKKLLIQWLSTLSLLGVSIPAPLMAQSRATLGQSWDKEEQGQFYFTSQGSKLIPYQWFLNLEQRAVEKSFTEREHLKTFGWIWQGEQDKQRNPDNLPIGFARAKIDQKSWLGFTCAACHTNELSYKGKKYIVDGGAADVDIGKFLVDLSLAIEETASKPNKLQKFSKRILGADASEEDLGTLQSEFLDFSTRFAGEIAMRTPPHPEGPGRVDALGQIMTAIGVFHLGEWGNYRPATAPVNNPFLWGTPFLDWVQWSAISSNPIGRNAGEALGVFADANLTGVATQPKIHDKQRESIEFEAMFAGPKDQILRVNTRNKNNHLKGAIAPPKEFLSSSVDFKALFHLEQWLRELEEPKWEEKSFGEINIVLARKGKILFDNDCRSCHNMPPFDYTRKEDNIVRKQFVKITKVDFQKVGTDPTYTLNLLSRSAQTGDMADVLFDGEQSVPAAKLFLSTTAAVTEKGLSDLKLSDQEKLIYSDFRYFPPTAPGEKPQPYRPERLTDLKAGPLLGIWATGPYLHNGSVPTIYDLLRPPEMRPKTFWVGGRMLDVEKLGFREAYIDKAGVRFDTSLPGNGNGGHNYPAKPYTDEEIFAVIEYLKDPRRFTE